MSRTSKAGRLGAAAMGVAAMFSAGAAAAEGGTKSTGLRHALIIDDEPDVAASLSDILELMGIKSRIARGWLSLAQTLSDLQPDIVFSDLRMPGTGGMEIYRRLQAERPALARRFVVVTGDLVGAKAEIEALPVADRPLIPEKPFSTRDVRGVLAALAATTGCAVFSQRERKTSRRPEPAGAVTPETARGGSFTPRPGDHT